MRECMGLYRGKGMITERWFLGFYVRCKLTSTGEIGSYIKTELENGDTGILYEVDPETVGECTGLTDIGETLIFEDDIVDFCGDYGIIEYDRDDARFMVFFDGWCTDFSHLRGKDVEIIGNIHDNPELLGWRLEQ